MGLDLTDSDFRLATLLSSKKRGMMKYSILQAWTEESGGTGLKVESVRSTGDLVRVRFSSKRDLILVAGSRDAYPFWTQDWEAGPEEESLWPQLTHAVLDSIEIAENDRVIRFSFDQTDIYQERRRYLIIAEFTPPKPNVILALQDDQLTVIDALRKYSYADNPARQILPRLPYQAAQTTFQAVRSELALPLILETGKAGGTIECDSFNTYLQNHYQHVILASVEEERIRNSRTLWERELKKTRQKLKKQQAELRDADKTEYWRVCAETLKQHLTEIARGQTSLTAVNYYDPELADIAIPLLADKSAQQNLQFYLKKYQKAKRGGEIIRQNIAQTEAAVGNLENILARLERGEFVELPGVKGVANLGRKLELLDKLLKLRLNEDFEIVIGRKARENDFITTQLGRPHDWWFHTRIYHGSHILLRCFRKTAPDEALIGICCSLAAWYSKARFSQNVPVDYTQLRFVRKPHKSAPGFVTYTSHRTVFAEPKDLRTVRAELQL